MLVLCISKGNGDPEKVTLPESGVVYRVISIHHGNIYSPTDSDLWYVLDKTGAFLQNPVLFEPLPDNFLTELSNVSLKQETVKQFN